MRILQLSFPIIIGLAIASAAAQSFDCAKATEPAEKFVCANKELSAADERMAAAFKAAMSQLSDEGKRRLIESQRSWIRFSRNISKLEVDYVKSEYQQRIEQLQKILQTFGPFTIQSISVYEADTDRPPPSSVSADPQALDAPTTIDFTFPRIESPATQETQRWNQMAEQRVRLQAGKLKQGTDRSVAFEVDYASQEIISIYLSIFVYGHGAAHPNQRSAGFSVLLKSGQELKASDLFNAQKPWRSFLSRYVLNRLKEHAAKEGWDMNDGVEDTMKDAGNTRRWSLSKEGLTVHFDPYEIAPYAIGSQQALVPWQALKPYLNPAPPFSVPLQ